MGKPMDSKSDIEVLEQFINNNTELELLEDIVEDFNIFSALSIIHNEIRHSNMLAWLMDPNESHGLGDYFLAIFLKRMASKTTSFGIESLSVFDIDSWHFDSAEILREYKHIDILIRSDEHKFICAIENKIRSREHSKQLQRYREAMQNEYPGYTKMFIYLTANGEFPSDENYVPISYAEVIPLLEHLTKSRKDRMGTEILTFISHYREMLRRYIMEDSEVQDICRKIYKRHKKALDLIFDNRSQVPCIVDELGSSIGESMPRFY